MSQAPDISGTEGERLDVTVTVDSTFGSQQTQTIELRIEDGGTTIHTDSQSVTLAGGANQQITLSWPTSDGDAGVYDLFLESDQDTIQRLVEVQSVINTFDHRWRHDEGAGGPQDTGTASTALDGTLNGPTWQSGGGTGSTHLEYDRSNDDYTQLPSAAKSELAHFANTGEGTLFTWVRPGDVTTGQDSSGADATIIGSRGGTTDSGQTDFTLHIDEDYRVRWFVADSTGGTGVAAVASSANAVAQGSWYSIGIREDGATAYLYLGTPGGSLSQVASASVSPSSGDIDHSVQFGAAVNDDGSIDSSDTFDGDIDRCLIDSSDVGEQRLKDIHDQTKADYQ